MVRARRQALALLLVSGLVLLGAGQSWAGSYLDRAGLLLIDSKRDSEFLSRRLGDRELARLVGQLATGRLQAAKETQVPREVVLAHPHLLLLLEHHERAAAAAAAGEGQRFRELLRSADEEEQLFRGVLRQLGWTVPSAR